jgi:hypothetical protein
VSLVSDLADDGLDYAEIIEELEDRGYDAEDIAEAMVDTGYDWEDALIEGIQDQQIDLDDARYYADLLDLDISDIYDMYYGYEED